MMSDTRLLGVVGGALAFLAATAASAQTAATRPESAGTAAESQTPATEAQSDTSPWRKVKFGGRLEGITRTTGIVRQIASSCLGVYDTRSYTFGIQQAALVVDAAPDVEANRRYGLRIYLQFGQATETLEGSPANEPRPDVYRNVWQAYYAYLFAVGANGLQADLGKLILMLGYETNYAKDNQAFFRA